MSATAVVRARSSPSGSALDRGVTVFCLSAVAALVVWSLIDRSGIASVAPAIAALGIIVGIPHGAVDHLIPGLALRNWSTSGHLGVVIGCYLLVAAVATTALLLVPDLSFAVFLLVSAVHFGWAETTYNAERDGGTVPRFRDGWWETVAHGSVIIVLPLWSAEGQLAMRPLVPSLVDRVSAVPAGWAVGAVVAVCAVGVIHLVAQRRVLAAVELTAVLALFALVPVFAAFGVYFGLWHAVRHTTRVMDALAPGRPIRFQLRAFLRASALPTAAALVVLALLFASRSNAGVVMTGVCMLLALTFPHVVVIAVLDHYRRYR